MRWWIVLGIVWLLILLVFVYFIYTAEDYDGPDFKGKRKGSDRGWRRSLAEQSWRKRFDLGREFHPQGRQGHDVAKSLRRVERRYGMRLDVYRH